MRFSRTLRTDANGEPVVWWTRHGRRIWLHTPHNTYGMEWWRWRGVGIRFVFADGAVGTAEFKVTIYLFVLALHFYIQSARWLRWLPGVGWSSGRCGNGKRELGFDISVGDGTGDLYLWLYPWSYLGGKRDTVLVNLSNIVLGWRKYSEENELSYDSQIAMPEGAYPASVRLYDAVWKRPRWPRPLRVARADVSIPGGIPIPGKGENGWDQDDNAYYEFTVLASTLTEAEQRVRHNVMEWRQRHGGTDWAPRAGWPAHCVRNGEGQ